MVSVSTAAPLPLAGRSVGQDGDAVALVAAEVLQVVAGVEVAQVVAVAPADLAPPPEHDLPCAQLAQAPVGDVGSGGVGR